MNLPFIYEADEDNGNQRFFSILMRAVKDGDVTAFDNGNDRFTTPLEVSKIATMLAGKKYTIQKPDLQKDPDMSLGIFKDTTIRDDFDERTIIGYRIKEEVVFDRETSRLHFRILGVAPVKAVLNDDGSFRDSYVAHRSPLLVARFETSGGVHRRNVRQCAPECRVEYRCRQIVVGVRPTRRLRHDFVDQPESQQVRCGQLQCVGGLHLSA